MQPAIRVDNLGKRYRLLTSAERAEYRTLRDTLVETVKSPLRRIRNGGATATLETSDFWALRDVSFEIQPGEVVGIIGRNGAGKSTLLKILSRITKPTTGRVEISGRVGSLLEVGTGFHPELSGRENIFLNGSILGMSHREIQNKFDEIVAFSEVEKFLDTPVKRYSSGMYVRLAFAVAAHLEPEILIVDEVLAVGDVQFQNKCLAKMKDVVRSGGTVLLVSHNMSTVEQLATRAIFLETGRVKYADKAAQVIRFYQQELKNATASDDLSRRRFGEGYSRAIEFASVELVGCDHQMLPAANPLTFDVHAVCKESSPSFRISFTIKRFDGTVVGSVFGPSLPGLERGQDIRFRVSLSDHRLAPGEYTIDMALGRGNNQDGQYEDFDIVLDAIYFQVLNPLSETSDPIAWFPGWGSIMFTQPQITLLS